MSQPNLSTMIESVAKNLEPKSQEDFRTLMTLVVGQVTSVSPGGNWQQFGAPSQSEGSTAAPPAASLVVTGQNANFSLTITLAPNTNTVTTVWNEVSYSTVKSFGQDVTTLPPSAQLHYSLNLPDKQYFFRVRSSYDQASWSAYQLAAMTPADSGLVSSAATSAGGAFNQTNLLNVDSVAAGGAASVRVYGSAPLRSGVALKGTVETILPSATIANVAPSSDHFVGWDGSEYVLKSSLAEVLADNLTPIGKVSVVGTGVPTLPVIHPVLGAGGAIVAYNVISGGAGATAPYTLTVTDPGGPGTGATTGTQTIVGGVLISVAPGNPGTLYDSSTIVTPTGGTFGGNAGGGTAAGGNGGRLTAV